MKLSTIPLKKSAIKDQLGLSYFFNMNSFNTYIISTKFLFLEYTIMKEHSNESANNASSNSKSQITSSQDSIVISDEEVNYSSSENVEKKSSCDKEEIRENIVDALYDNNASMY